MCKNGPMLIWKIATEMYIERIQPKVQVFFTRNFVAIKKYCEFKEDNLNFTKLDLNFTKLFPNFTTKNT